MEQPLTKESAKKLLEIKGEVRGATIKGDWSFVLEREGREGLEKLEKRMAELGCPLKYEGIKVADFYPIGCGAISVQLIHDLFGYKDKETQEMGASQFKFSLFLRIVMRYFAHPSLFTEEIPRIWRRNYTIGNLSVAKINEKEKYMILVLKDFKIHPHFCIAFKGAFSAGTKLATRSNSVSCQETKCIFKGDEFCEFLLRW